MMINSPLIKYMVRVTSKPRKIYKKPFYDAIPKFHKPHEIDIHDGYTYRSYD